MQNEMYVNCVEQLEIVIMMEFVMNLINVIVLQQHTMEDHKTMQKMLMEMV